MLTAWVKGVVSFHGAQESIVKHKQRGVLRGWGHNQERLEQGDTYVTSYVSCCKHNADSNVLRTVVQSSVIFDLSSGNGSSCNSFPKYWMVQ